MCVLQQLEEERKTHVDLFVPLHTDDVVEDVNLEVTRKREGCDSVPPFIPCQHAEVRHIGVLLSRCRHVVRAHSLEVYDLVVERRVMRVSGHVTDGYL